MSQVGHRVTVFRPDGGPDEILFWAISPEGGFIWQTTHEVPPGLQPGSVGLRQWMDSRSDIGRSTVGHPDRGSRAGPAPDPDPNNQSPWP